MRPSYSWHVTGQPEYQAVSRFTAVRPTSIFTEIKARLVLTEKYVEQLRTGWRALPEDHRERRELLRQLEQGCPPGPQSSPEVSGARFAVAATIEDSKASGCRQR